MATTALTAVYRAETAALATYQNVVTKLGSVRPFVNVIDSERQHVATVKGLMSAHGVAIPTVASGQASPSTRALACALGVRTEQGVIGLYDQYLPQIKSYPDLVRAFDNLRAGSANSHLPAFQHCS
ncbi:MAG: ferritin family protein [Solirubrobacteraceae bacterium]